MPALLSLQALSPTDLAGTKSDLCDHVSSICQIHAYTKLLKDTAVTNVWQTQSPPQPTPAWFPDLLAKLQAAQQHAVPWDKDIQPQITAAIPQAVIRYSVRFKIGCLEILSILNSTAQPTKQEAQLIRDQLMWIGRHLTESKGNITAAQAEFATFQANAHADFDQLNTGLGTITTAVNDLAKKMTDLQNEIDRLNAEIASDKQIILEAIGAAGAGLVVGTATIFLAAAAGPLAPVVMVLGGLVLLGSVATIAAILGKYLPEINNDTAQVNADNAEYAQEEILKAGLIGIGSSIGALAKQNAAMSDSLAAIATWWAGLEAKLAALQQDIADADEDTLARNWVALKDDVQAAMADWDDYGKFATQMQSVTTGALQNMMTVPPLGRQAA